MEKKSRATQPKITVNELKRARDAATELRILVSRILEALEFYDSDDGHNDLVLAGAVAEKKRIEDDYGDVLFARSAQ